MLLELNKYIYGSHFTAVDVAGEIMTQLRIYYVQYVVARSQVIIRRSIRGGQAVGVFLLLLAAENVCFSSVYSLHKGNEKKRNDIKTFLTLLPLFFFFGNTKSIDITQPI
jgi:hypothetical protein